MQAHSMLVQRSAMLVVALGLACPVVAVQAQSAPQAAGSATTSAADGAGADAPAIPPSVAGDVE